MKKPVKKNRIFFFLSLLIIHMNFPKAPRPMLTAGPTPGMKFAAVDAMPTSGFFTTFHTFLIPVPTLVSFQKWFQPSLILAKKPFFFCGAGVYC